MSYREKTSWVSLVTMGVVYGWYFWKVMPAFVAEHDTALLHAALVLPLTVVAVAVLQVIPLIALAIASPTDARAPHDERERFYSLKGTQVAYYVLVTGALSTSVAGIFLGANAGMLANLILLSVVTSNLAKYATEVTYYRLGA